MSTYSTLPYDTLSEQKHRHFVLRSRKKHPLRTKTGVFCAEEQEKIPSQRERKQIGAIEWDATLSFLNFHSDSWKPGEVHIWKLPLLS